MSEIKKLGSLILEASNSDQNVLIRGELGSGKEYTAQSIHNNSLRKSNTFVTLNVTTITKLTNKFSYLETADEGTLYLDEIANLEHDNQLNLIEFIKTKKVKDQNSLKTKQYNIRFIASTTKNLIEEVEKGRFIFELYNLLSEMVIELTALRYFGEEIIDLANIFILDYCKKNRKPLKQLSNGAKKLLMSYHYPQNFRELRAIIELTLMTSSSSIIYPEEIYLPKGNQAECFFSKEKTLKEYEAEIVSHFLEKYDNKVYYVAEKLGISKNKIYNMINQGLIKLEE
ncbi:MAG: sigma-54-dependent transcriptional regulator [Bacteroidales bacterium]